METDISRCDTLITVDEQGKFQATVSAMDAIALHKEALITSQPEGFTYKSAR